MEMPRCRGLGLEVEEYIVLLEPQPWPRPFRLETYTSAFCCLAGCLCQCLGQCGKALAEDLFQCFCQVLCCSPWILLILLTVLNFKGSRAPRTELEALTVDQFLLTRDNTSLITPGYHVNGIFTVRFQAYNPSSVVGFRHRYLSTFVTVYYNDTQLGQTEVPRFSQSYKSARNVSTIVAIREQRLNESVGLSLTNELQNDMQTQAGVGLRITVDAYVKVKRLGWQGPKWFNLTCSVKATMITKADNLLSKSCN